MGRRAQKDLGKLKTEQAVVDGSKTEKNDHKLDFFAEADDFKPGNNKRYYPPSYWAERIVQALRYFNSGDANAVYDNVVRQAKEAGLTTDGKNAIDTLLTRWQIPVKVSGTNLQEIAFPGETSFAYDKFNQRQVAAQLERNLKTWQCPKCGTETSNGYGSRRCENCGYTGDWIQPGETESYEHKNRNNPESIFYNPDKKLAWEFFKQKGPHKVVWQYSDVTMTRSFDDEDDARGFAQHLAEKGMKPEVLNEPQLFRSQWYPEEYGNDPMELRDAKTKSTGFPFVAIASKTKASKDRQAVCEDFLKAYRYYVANKDAIQLRYKQAQLDSKITKLLENNFAREEIAKELPNWEFPEDMKKEAIRNLLPKKVVLSGPRLMLANDRSKKRKERKAEAIALIAEHSKLDGLTDQQKLRISSLKSKYNFSTPVWLEKKIAQYSLTTQLLNNRAFNLDWRHCCNPNQMDTAVKWVVAHYQVDPAQAEDAINRYVNYVKSHREFHFAQKNKFVEDEESLEPPKAAPDPPSEDGINKWIEQEDKDQKKFAQRTKFNPAVMPGTKWCRVCGKKPGVPHTRFCEYKGTVGGKDENFNPENMYKDKSPSEQVINRGIDKASGWVGKLFGDSDKPKEPQMLVDSLQNLLDSLGVKKPTHVVAMAARLNDGRVLQAVIDEKGEFRSATKLDYNLKKAIRKADSFEEGWITYLHEA